MLVVLVLVVAALVLLLVVLFVVPLLVGGWCRCCLVLAASRSLSSAALVSFCSLDPPAIIHRRWPKGVGRIALCRRLGVLWCGAAGWDEKEKGLC